MATSTGAHATHPRSMWGSPGALGFLAGAHDLGTAHFGGTSSAERSRGIQPYLEADGVCLRALARRAMQIALYSRLVVPAI